MSAYIALARRYRPTTLSDLVGQDVLKETLAKAIIHNHLPHGILLHGIRGIGKTTTARIIARALNCHNNQGGDPCGVCPSCVDIDHDRHLDVIEMDGASHTSVDSIREIIESARYKAVSGRFKIFIIDEVHMLSKSAFNALLKTLEEPPLHVKFIFATTEIKKIPDTILSRVMHFDLKPIDGLLILNHLKTICGKEGIESDEDALGLIARYADGSMRDGLSLLDQAAAYSMAERTTIHITLDMIEKMLGCANREHMLNLCHLVLKGDVGTVITKVEEILNQGVTPLLLVQDFLDCLYFLTCFKHDARQKNNPLFTQQERDKAHQITHNLPLVSLARLFQFFSKGYEDVQKNPLPKQACVMVFIRICHLGPSVDLLLTNAGGSGEIASQGGTATVSALPSAHVALTPLGCDDIPKSPESATQSVSLTTSEPAIPEFQPQTPLQLVVWLRSQLEFILADHIEKDMKILDYKPFHITVHQDVSASLIKQLRAKLNDLTGQEWIITLTHGDDDVETIYTQQQRYKNVRVDQAKETPAFQALAQAFAIQDITYYGEIHEN